MVDQEDQRRIFIGFNQMGLILFKTDSEPPDWLGPPSSLTLSSEKRRQLFFSPSINTMKITFTSHHNQVDPKERSAQYSSEVR